jgi:hypothetical protein
VLTGVVFLILIVSVISANHLLASSKHYGDAVQRDMEIDVVYNTIDDINNVLAFDKDNTFADGLSDLAYSRATGPPVKSTKTVCNVIKEGNTLESKFWDDVHEDGYIQQTIASIETLAGVEISNEIDNHDHDKWHKGGEYSTSTKSCRFEVLLNITYTVKYAGIERTILLESHKNMTLTEVDDGDGNTGTSIKVEDDPGIIDFYYTPF